MGGAATGGKSSTGGAATGGAGTGGANTGCTATGFHTLNGKIYDNHCNEFIMRGINYPYAWYTTNTETRFADMASTKANSARIVLSVSRWGTTSASTISSIIATAKANKMVALLEVHDCTGYGDDSAALTPDTCVQFWLKSDIVNALKGNEAYVMINIANEAFGNDASSQWQAFYQTNVPKFRTAGLKHTLIVDAPNWGQDWSNTMRDGTGATAIFDADPDKNVVFSTHMYDVYSSASAVTSYFSKFLAKGLPFIIGEFASDHGSKGDVDDATIMSQCQQLGVGYLGWSWSGNSSDLATLDITNNFNVSSLTTWGSALINGSNGIKATAEPCSCLQ
jgi:mannan endo-1,4-beta-mannosidase